MRWMRETEMMKQMTIAGGAMLALIAGLYAASLVAVTGPASANQCASACYAAHSQCRVSTKGSPSCDAQLSRCLSGCGRK